MTKQEVVADVLRKLKSAGLLNEAAVKNYLTEAKNKRYLKREKKVITTAKSTDVLTK